MERWQYAIGEQGMDESWHIDVEGLPDYEAATRALTRYLVESRNSDWTQDPQIVKRSDRHPAWQPVKDHAAELLAEVLEAVRLDFATIGSGIVQGSDVAKIFRKRALILRNVTDLQGTEEYDG